MVVSTDRVAAPARGDRLRRRVRWLFVRGLAAVVAGTVVLGIGGRLVMFASRLLHPDAVGRLTENGNRVGEVTLGGTLQLLLFGGLLGGVLGGIVWALVASWVQRRSWLVGLVTTALAGPALIQADNRDFVVLDPPFVDLALLLGLAFAFGVTVCVLDCRLDGWLADEPSAAITGFRAVALLLVAPLVIPLFGGFFSREFCFCEHPPVATGIFLVAAGAISLSWWVAELRGRASPPRGMVWAGRAAVGLAVAASAVDLGTELLLLL